jgi:hypothetical protein
METKSGWLHMSKTERREIETVLSHCQIDLSYRGGGTFNTGEQDKYGNDEFDTTEAKKALRGIQHIQWILSTYLD